MLEKIPKTALDVFRLLPEGTLCDVIDNVLYMSTVPKYTHQRLLLHLAKKISQHIEKSQAGEVFISPVDVYLDEFLSAVQPDLIYVSDESKDIIKDDGYFHGAPDLVIEVLSNDRKRDTVLKKDLYEKAGVKEYHITDPDSRMIQSFILENGNYVKKYENHGVFKSDLLGLEFSF